MSTITPHKTRRAPRPLRADAARNRERVIAAARTVLAEKGGDAQIEDVARAAGVGVGTVYRHFSTKEGLIDAAIEDRFDELLERCREALAMDDAWEGIRTAFTRCAELNAEDRCLCGIVGAQMKTSPALEPLRNKIRGVWCKLFDRAHAAGSLRADVGVDDLPNLMCGLASVVVRAESPDQWRRYLDVMLAGLQAPVSR